jgi:hypothetical protein
MAGLAITALFGFVAYILSWGLFVPNDLKVFNILAAVASMAGYPLGELAVKNITSPRGQAACIASSAVVCVAAVIGYAILIQQGYADVSAIVILALLLTTIFFSLTFLMPFAGVVIGKRFT